MKRLGFMVVNLLWVYLAFEHISLAAENVDSVKVAIDETVAAARTAIDKYGESDSAMWAIQSALGKLATVKGLRKRVDLRALHGSSNMGSAVLASEGENGITLFLARFGKGATTPIHDHLTWGVVRVLEGEDRYIHWKRKYEASDTSKAKLEIKFEKLLQADSSVYWFGPPHDIHSQEARNGDVWELVITGKNVTADIVLNHRHYFDPNTGQVKVGKQQ